MRSALYAKQKGTPALVATLRNTQKIFLGFLLCCLAPHYSTLSVLEHVTLEFHLTQSVVGVGG